jgi:hypothetical protein
MEGDVFMTKGQSHFTNAFVRKRLAWTLAGHCRQFCELSEKISMRLRREPAYNA